MYFNFLLLVFIYFIIELSGSPVSRSTNYDSIYTDRTCGEDLSKLWLDIVIVVDNSKGMTNRGLSAVAADISSLFINNLQMGIQTNQPRTTRVGIVTYNKDATTVADLNKFVSVTDLITSVYSTLNKVVNTDESYLETGLEAAEELLKEQSFNTSRDHYKKLIIVYASEYKGTGQLDPLPLSNRLRSSGIAIATVAYGQDNNDGYLDKLAAVATPGYSFTNQQNTVGELRNTMLQVNCYCPNGWYQMRQSFSNIHSSKYGICIIPTTLQATFIAAKLSCRNQWKNAYLVNEYTQRKHDYVLEIVRNTTAFKPPYIYFIGLEYFSGNWYWEQPPGKPGVLLQNWNDWNSGFPVSSSTKTVGIAKQNSSNVMATGWENTDKSVTEFYVCEVASCDSTNYCARDED